MVKKMLLPLFLIFIFFTFSPLPLSANPVENDINSVTSSEVFTENQRHNLLTDVLTLCNDPNFQKAVNDRLIKDDDSTMMRDLFKDYQPTFQKRGERSIVRNIIQLDQKVRRAKGIENYANSLFQVRLVSPSIKIRSSELPWDDLLVAVEPIGDEDQWKDIPAYDLKGNLYLLDPWELPDVPVLVPGINEREDLKAGIAFLNDELVKKGFQQQASFSKRAAPNETSKLTKAWCQYDQEPWIKGRAEMYGIVSGVQKDQKKAAITIVDMPWWDYDKTDYYPNQVVIFWHGYQFGAANILLYEHDSNYNYYYLLKVLTEGVKQALIFTGNPQYTWIVDIGNAIIDVMPDGFFTDDDDFVDAFYTIEKNQTLRNKRGAGGNASISLVPYILPPN